MELIEKEQRVQLISQLSECAREVCGGRDWVRKVVEKVVGNQQDTMRKLLRKVREQEEEGERHYNKNSIDEWKLSTYTDLLR